MIIQIMHITHSSQSIPKTAMAIQLYLYTCIDEVQVNKMSKCYLLGISHYAICLSFYNEMGKYM